MPIYDFYDDDQGHMFNVISREYNIGLVKQASEEPRHFAWREERRFPLDTPDDIAMSYLYFQKTSRDIPEEFRDEIGKKITKAANFLGMDLSSLHKTPMPVAEINPDQFAISIPISKIPPAMKTKVANYIYNNHFSLYPLNTPSNVKTANYIFPQGLEDLPSLQPVVAQRIAEAVGNLEELKPEVAKWLPFSKTAMIEELDTRAHLTDKGQVYQEIARDLLALPDSLDNRSYLYKKMKTASVLAPTDPRRSFSEPERFLSGWVEDVEVIREFRINDRSYPEKVFKEKAASLAAYYPEITSLCNNPDSSYLQSYLESLEDVDLDIIEGILRHD